MTDQTFTIEQIQAAWDKYWPTRIPENRSVKGLIAELTKPVWMPEVGKVVKYGTGDDPAQYARVFEGSAIVKDRNTRPLTDTEGSRTELVEAMETALKYITPMTAAYKTLDEALTAHRERYEP